MITLRSSPPDFVIKELHRSEPVQLLDHERGHLGCPDGGAPQPHAESQRISLCIDFNQY
jgi:hypothetical protein